MNCLDFRRQLNIDPQTIAQEFLRHRQQCVRCAQAHERALDFEATLQRALAIDVPAQLAESILLTQATEQHRQRRRYFRRGGALALAAVAVAAVGMSMYLRTPQLSTLAVEHVAAPAEHFALALTQPVSDDSVRQAFAKRGINLQQIPSGISYVQCCPVGRFNSVHMVMPGKHGPVSVFYVNNDRVASARNFVRDGMHGRSIPMGNGTLVLVAQNAGQFDQLEQQWRLVLQPVG